jgi:hypothetical protein
MYRWYRMPSLLFGELWANVGTPKMNERPSEKIVKEGTFLYAETVECRVKIVKVNFRPGTGDHEDEPEFRDDVEGTFYDVWYQPPRSDSFSSGVIGFDSVDAAARHVESSCPGVRWQ